MKTRTLFMTLLALVALTFALAACGGPAPVAANDLPIFPGAEELKAGDSRIGNTLANNMSTDAALRQAMGSGGKMEQRGFALPKGTTWDAVNKFYEDKLKAGGWGSPNSMASNILSVVNAQNEMFQNTIYTRNNQTIAIIRLQDPISKDVTLLLSLNTR